MHAHRYLRYNQIALIDEVDELLQRVVAQVTGVAALLYGQVALMLLSTAQKQGRISRVCNHFGQNDLIFYTPQSGGPTITATRIKADNGLAAIQIPNKSFVGMVV